MRPDPCIPTDSVAPPPEFAGGEPLCAWVVARLIEQPALGAALRAAMGADGGVDRAGLVRAMLAVTAVASGYACTGPEVRRVVGDFVRAALPPALAPEAADRAVQRATGFVDALYLTLGRAGFTADFETVRRAVPALVDGSE